MTGHPEYALPLHGLQDVIELRRRRLIMPNEPFLEILRSQSFCDLELIFGDVEDRLVDIQLTVRHPREEIADRIDCRGDRGSATEASNDDSALGRSRCCGRSGDRGKSHQGNTCRDKTRGNPDRTRDRLAQLEMIL